MLDANTYVHATEIQVQIFFSITLVLKKAINQSLNYFYTNFQNKKIVQN